MQRARMAADGDFPALLAEVDTLFPKGSSVRSFEARDAAQKWLLGLWISRDVAAAAAHVVSLNDAILGSSFGLVLGSVAPGKVAEILSGPHAKGLGEFFNSAVMRSLSAADPHEYVRIAAGNGKDTPRYWSRALQTIAGKDPAEAARLWQTRTGTHRTEALDALLGVWVKQDAAAARRWLEQLPDAKERLEATHAWLGALASSDLAAARTQLLEIDLGKWEKGPQGYSYPPIYYLTDARAAVLVEVAKQDLPLALRDLAALKARGLPESPGKDEEGREIPSAAQSLLAAMSEAAAPALPSDPAALLAQLARVRDASGMTAQQFKEFELLCLDKKLFGFSAPDAIDSLRTLAAETDLAGRGKVLSSLIANASRTDRDAALGVFDALPAATQREIADQGASDLMHVSPEAFARVAAHLSSEKWTADMAGMMAGAKPEVLANVIAALPVAPQTTEARQAFASRWAQDDPEAAAHWANGLPPGAASAQTAQSVADAWARYDETAASAWAATLPPGKARNGAAAGLVAAVAGLEPDSAWKWAQAITDPALSVGAYREVARSWGNEAPPEFRGALTAALDAAAASPGEREELLRYLDAPGKPNAAPAK